MGRAERSDADLAILSRDLDSLERANGAGDVKSYLSANYTFHFAIYRAAGSENLLKIIKDLWLQISPYLICCTIPETIRPPTSTTGRCLRHCATGTRSRFGPRSAAISTPLTESWSAS